MRGSRRRGKRMRRRKGRRKSRSKERKNSRRSMESMRGKRKESTAHDYNIFH